MLVAIMSKFLSVTFRIPTNMVKAFNSAVSVAGSDKTAWLINAISLKTQPASKCRLLTLTERIETTALIGGKQGIPSMPYNEAVVITIG